MVKSDKTVNLLKLDVSLESFKRTLLEDLLCDW